VDSANGHSERLRLRPFGVTVVEPTKSAQSSAAKRTPMHIPEAQAPRSGPTRGDFPPRLPRSPDPALVDSTPPTTFGSRSPRTRPEHERVPVRPNPTLHGGPPVTGAPVPLPGPPTEAKYHFCHSVDHIDRTFTEPPLACPPIPVRPRRVAIRTPWSDATPSPALPQHRRRALCHAHDRPRSRPADLGAQAAGASPYRDPVNSSLVSTLDGSLPEPYVPEKDFTRGRGLLTWVLR
jgi:hypothetical protein